MINIKLLDYIPLPLNIQFINRIRLTRWIDYDKLSKTINYKVLANSAFDEFCADIDIAINDIDKCVYTLYTIGEKLEREANLIGFRPIIVLGSRIKMISENTHNFSIHEQPSLTSTQKHNLNKYVKKLKQYKLWIKYHKLDIINRMTFSII
jgi:hypothetical protein